MKKMKQITAVTMALIMALGLTACGNKNTTAPAASVPASEPAAAETQEAVSEEPASTTADTGDKEVLEFYHAYFQDEATWHPAVVMREIYQAFADAHADGDVVFTPIPVEDLAPVYSNAIAAGSFPDMIDLAGTSLPNAAVAQKLVYDMKPYVDAEGIQDQLGLNYTQNDIDGAIYTVHDQLLTLGMWVNTDVLASTGASAPDTWNSWDAFAEAMETVRTKGEADGIYSYGSGQGSVRMFNAALAATDKGAALLDGPITADGINSAEFEEAFKTVANMDQKNGSANSAVNANDFSADFNDGKSAVFVNGVWAAGGFADSTSFAPTVYPGNVALSSAGGGLTIANGLSEAQTELALEFIKYMTSEEVQTRIFLEVQANPCNPALDLEKLAASGDASVALLAKACSQCNNAGTIVRTIDAAWGSDIATAVQNKLTECSVSGADIDTIFAALKDELIALIG